MRRVLTSLSITLAAVVATAVSAPAAFAMRVVGPSGGAPSRTGSQVAAVHTHGGLVSWEIAVIVVGASILVIAACALTALSRRRRVLRPATI